jgi:hypothetical protein
MDMDTNIFGYRSDNFYYFRIRSVTPRAETLRRQHLMHQSDGPQPASPTNKKNNKETK